MCKSGDTTFYLWVPDIFIIVSRVVGLFLYQLFCQVAQAGYLTDFYVYVSLAYESISSNPKFSYFIPGISGHLREKY